MKPKNNLLVPALVILGSMLTGQLKGQTFTILHSFAAGTNGSFPSDSLYLSGNTLYGTTADDNDPGYGTVFAINTDGTGFRILHRFTTPSGPSTGLGTNYDGATPLGDLILSGGTLYGTASVGGTWGYGTVFAIQTDGTRFTNLHNFVYPSYGTFPYGGLLLSGSTLYGTASFGPLSSGSVFAMNADGTGFTTLYAFGTVPGDGAAPYAGLILSGDTLYGTAREGGGNVFAVKTNGTGFRILHPFSASDGDEPTCTLILSSNILYGTTSGWAGGNSTVFAIKTDGSGFTNLYTFTGADDGQHPPGGVALLGNTLYGTTEQGGTLGYGTVFSVNVDGTGFQVVHTFASGPGDGSFPRAGLIYSNHTLYGTTHGGGSSWAGTVFSIALPGPVELNITPSGSNVVLTWPTNAAGLNLESTTNLGSSAIWTTNLPAPVVVNGMNTVTTPISGTQQFFRLSQ